MTQEDKELLLKDLCARLPYGVKFTIDEMYLTDDMIKRGYGKTQELYGITREGNVELLNMDYHMPLESIKPYLFPLSSMTEEQEEEYLSTCNGYCTYYWTEETFNWLIENNFDYNGLIPMKLAIDATDKNIYD